MILFLLLWIGVPISLFSSKILMREGDMRVGRAINFVYIMGVLNLAWVSGCRELPCSARIS